MNSVVILFFLFTEYCLCDWIEIKQSSNHQPHADSTKKSVPNNLKSTPVPYDVFMVTPLTKIDEVTTISNDRITPIITTTNQVENSVLTTTENIIPKTLNQDFPNTTESFSKTENSKPVQDNTKKKQIKNSLNYEGFQSFINGIQANLLDRKNKSAHNKLTVLRNLRDNLLINIEERISNLWKNGETSRESRTYKDYDHEMEFPSNEGALMTIGFLTFAVFLIKLVLKLLYALKYKQTVTTTTGTTTAGGGTVTIIGRKKREITEEHLRLLQLIDEYKYV